MCGHEICGLCVDVILIFTLHCFHCERYFFFNFFFNEKKIFFLRAVLGSQQNLAEGTGSSQIPLPPHMHSLPGDQRLSPRVHLLQSVHLHWHIVMNQSPSFAYIRIQSPCHTCCGSGQCQMTCTHHCSMPTTDLFTVSLVLSFPKCHILRIIQYVAFSGELRVFSRLDSFFLFSTR